MFQNIHQQFAPDIEAARPTPEQIAARCTPEVPALADLLAYEAGTAAWFKAHGTTAQDARCKGCEVEYLKGELSADGLCDHCADEHSAAFYDMSQDVGGFYDQDTMCNEVAQQPVPCLPLGAPVRITTLGVNGVISGRSTCDSSRYRVTWFNRHFWAVRHEWVGRGVIEVLKQTTAHQ